MFVSILIILSMMLFTSLPLLLSTIRKKQNVPYISDFIAASLFFQLSLGLQGLRFFLSTTGVIGKHANNIIIYFFLLATVTFLLFFWKGVTKTSAYPRYKFLIYTGDILVYLAMISGCLFFLTSSGTILRILEASLGTIMVSAFMLSTQYKRDPLTTSGFCSVIATVIIIALLTILRSTTNLPLPYGPEIGIFAAALFTGSLSTIALAKELTNERHARLDLSDKINLTSGMQKRSLPTLSRREQEIVELMLKKKNSREIARHLTCSEKTVRNHFSNIYTKYGVRNKAELVIVLSSGR